MLTLGYQASTNIFGFQRICVNSWAATADGFLFFSKHFNFAKANKTEKEKKKPKRQLSKSKKHRQETTKRKHKNQKKAINFEKKNEDILIVF